MNALIRLYLTRMKANIRNVFSKPSSAIFTIILILIYGGLIIAMLMKPSMTLTMNNASSINISIMLGIGFTAMMVGMILLQKRKALFMENDAFYLFSGPFTRPQIMRFLMSQSILSSVMCGLFSLFMMILMGSSLSYDPGFLILCVLGHGLVYFFFTTLYYYVYLLSIQDEKFKNISTIVVAVFVCIILIVYAMAFIQNDFQFQAAGSDFLNGDLFYSIPLFGWIKLMLISYVSGDVTMILLAAVLLVAASYGIYTLMCRYKGDFVEKAMQDAEEFSALYKEVKEGKRSTMNDQKVRDVKTTFREGAAAIYSKNMLMMRKTRDFIRWPDIISILIYFAVSWIADMGYIFFVYMLIFYLFSIIQNSDFMRDMNNYQIYLIPDKPLKKMLYVILPTFIKLVILIGVSAIVGGVLLGAGLMEIAQYAVMLLGYIFLFISATVLSLRILKSRSNVMMENMMRMGIIIIAALPSIGLIFYFMSRGDLTLSLLTSMSLLSLAMNFIISIIIIVLCANMMNGRELKSE